MPLLTKNDIDTLRRRLQDINVLAKPEAPVVEPATGSHDDAAVTPVPRWRFSPWKGKKKLESVSAKAEDGATGLTADIDDSMEAEKPAPAVRRQRSSTVSSLRRRMSVALPRRRSHTVVAGADVEVEQSKKELQQQFADRLLTDLDELDLEGSAESLVKALLPIFEQIAVEIKQNRGFELKYEKDRGSGYRQTLYNFVRSLIWRVVAYEELVLDFLDVRSETKRVLGEQQRKHEREAQRAQEAQDQETRVWQRRLESDGKDTKPSPAEYRDHLERISTTGQTAKAAKAAAKTIKAQLAAFEHAERCMLELPVVKAAMEQVTAAAEHARSSWSDYQVLAVSSEAETDDSTFRDEANGVAYKKGSRRPWDQHVIKFSCRSELSQAKADAIRDSLNDYAGFSIKPSVILDFAGCKMEETAWQTICESEGFYLVCSLNLSGQPRSLAMMRALANSLGRYKEGETPSRLEDLVLRDAGLAVPSEPLDPAVKGLDYQDKSPLIALCEGVSKAGMALQHVDLAGNGLPFDLIDPDYKGLDEIERCVHRLFLGYVASMLFSYKDNLLCRIDLSGVCVTAEELEQVLNACPAIHTSLEVISDLDMATVASTPGCMLAKQRAGRFLLRLSDGRIFISKSATQVGDVVELGRTHILRQILRQQTRAAVKGRHRTMSVSTTTTGHVAYLLSATARPETVAGQLLTYRDSWLRVYNSLAEVVQSHHMLTAKQWRRLHRNVGLGLFDSVAKAESKGATLSSERRTEIRTSAEAIRQYINENVAETGYVVGEKDEIVDVAPKTIRVLIYNFVCNWSAVMAQFNELKDGLEKWQVSSKVERDALVPEQRLPYLIQVLNGGCVGLQCLLEEYLGRPVRADEEAQPALDAYKPIEKTKRGAAILHIYQQARYIVDNINKLVNDARSVAEEEAAGPASEPVEKVVGVATFGPPADSPLVTSPPVPAPTTPRDEEEVVDGATAAPTVA